MPVYECSLPTCSNQYTDGTPRRSMYCVYHRTMEPMRPDAGESIEFKQDGKVRVTLTVDQVNELTETLRKHHADETVGLRPIPVAQIEADQFWKEVLTDVAAEQGLSMAEAIRRELHDYKFIMDNMPQILEHATGGKLSKLMYPADVVCAEIDDHINSVVAAAVKEVTDDRDEQNV